MEEPRRISIEITYINMLLATVDPDIAKASLENDTYPGCLAVVVPKENKDTDSRNS